MLPRLHHIRALRRLVLPTLKRLNPGTITVRHHWTGDPFHLDAFRHKGYWYHGKRRERSTMQLFAELLQPGDFVVEIGGHIGYVALYLASLVGASGKLLVFEPGPNNLTYLKRNVSAKPWITIVEQAATNHGGTADFHVENLTGQNNSLLQHYAPREANEARAFVSDVGASTVRVACTTLDAFLADKHLPVPALMKIDVEGAELSVLEGMPQTLRASHLALMVEVTERSAEVTRLLLAAGYRLFTDDRQPVPAGVAPRGNIFCVKPEDPRLARFGSQGTERNAQAAPGPGRLEN